MVQCSAAGPNAPVLGAEQYAAFLAEASKQLADWLDESAALRGIPRLVVPQLADWCAVDLLDEEGSIRRLASAHVDAAGAQVGFELARRYPPPPTAPHGVPKVLRTGCSILVADITDTLLASQAQDAEHLDLMRRLGLVSAIVVPLVARERILGALTMATCHAERRYTEVQLGLAEDLAARCALALDNARRYQQAREAIQLRDTFLATVSHDLRTPLATIGAQAQLLHRLANREGGPFATRMIDGLTRIETTFVRMSRLLDELLDVARLEQGRPIELDRRHVDLVSLARRLMAEHQQLTSRHVLQLAGESELVGEWDEGRLARVLDNLLGNAIKYSPEGGVITVVVAREDDDDGAWAILSVRDPGVGIPAADLPRIFEQFQRARNVGRIGGTGVGLAVSRQIVERHGGSILVDSQEGQGSAFTVRLPLVAPRPADNEGILPGHG